LKYLQKYGILIKNGGFIMKYLIVVDMQVDFITGSLGSEHAVDIVTNVVNKVKSFDGKVIFTRDTHFEDYMSTQEGKNLPIIHCVKDTDGWQLDSKVQSALENREYKTIEKLTFGSTELPEYIKQNYNVNDIEIELIGLCTDICVVSNALLLKANLLETKISVDAKCCAGVTVDSHNAALTTMKMCQIDVKE
jgi:nicotinamidase-related amidase